MGLYQMNECPHKHARHYFQAEGVVDIHTDMVCLWERVAPCPSLR